MNWLLVGHLSYSTISWDRHSCEETQSWKEQKPQWPHVQEPCSPGVEAQVCRNTVFAVQQVWLAPSVCREWWMWWQLSYSAPLCSMTPASNLRSWALGKRRDLLRLRGQTKGGFFPSLPETSICSHATLPSTLALVLYWSLERKIFSFPRLPLQAITPQSCSSPWQRGCYLLSPLPVHSLGNPRISIFHLAQGSPSQHYGHGVPNNSFLCGELPCALQHHFYLLFVQYTLQLWKSKAKYSTEGKRGKNASSV